MKLTGDQVEFFKYFIKQYNENVERGEIDESHHCAVAVLLELQSALGIDDE